MIKLTSLDPEYKIIIDYYKKGTEKLKSGVVLNEAWSNQLNKKVIQKKYHKLFDFLFSPRSVGFILLSHKTNETLKYHYKKRDFIFKGNRTYYNYIVKCGGTHFILSEKIEWIKLEKNDLNNDIMEMLTCFLKLKCDYLNTLKLESVIKKEVDKLSLILENIY